ncbi:exported hypothetical protein [Candidatus Terasakiella magnetica]|nr:exported hypothetical protein [Candidatus Terasakiella magnetica]
MTWRAIVWLMMFFTAGNAMAELRNSIPNNVELMVGYCHGVLTQSTEATARDRRQCQGISADATGKCLDGLSTVSSHIQRVERFLATKGYSLDSNKQIADAVETGRRDYTSCATAQSDRGSSCIETCNTKCSYDIDCVQTCVAKCAGGDVCAKVQRCFKPNRYMPY